MIRAASLALLLLAAAPAATAEPVSRTIVEADGTRTLVHEVEIPAPPSDVWRAISTAEGWKSWAVPLARLVDDNPDLIETSYDPAAAPGGPATIRQLFVARIPNRLLAFRTVKAPEGFPAFETFAKVVSIFELEPRPEGRTFVRLTSAGYADSEDGRKLAAFFDGGNRTSLSMLRKSFVDGPVDWEKINQGK